MLKSGIYDFVICRGGTDMCFVLGFGRQRPDLKQYRISGLTSDEDIPTNVTPTSSPTTHIGPVTRARAHQLNYQVLSFLANPSNVHEHMMLPKLDTFFLLMNEGPIMDKKDSHWSGIKHGEEGARL